MLATSNIQEPLNFVGNVSANSVTTQALALPKPSMPTQDVEVSLEHPIPKGPLSSRGYSDSAVPSCRLSGAKVKQIGKEKNLTSNSQSMNESTPLPLNVNARENLRLPCFKSLGISSRLPDALLTPPDEGVLELTQLPSNPINRSASFPPNMPKTPSPDRDLSAAANDSHPLVINNTQLTDTRPPFFTSSHPTPTQASTTTRAMTSTSQEEKKEQPMPAPTTATKEIEEPVQAVEPAWTADALIVTGMPQTPA